MNAYKQIVRSIVVLLGTISSHTLLTAERTLWVTNATPYTLTVELTGAVNYANDTVTMENVRVPFAGDNTITPGSTHLFSAQSTIAVGQALQDIKPHGYATLISFALNKQEKASEEKKELALATRDGIPYHAVINHLVKKVTADHVTIAIWIRTQDGQDHLVIRSVDPLEYELYYQQTPGYEQTSIEWQP